MKTSTSDRRIRKTIAQIRKTFTQLLMEKDLKDITVSELTDLADINRGTFYLHYKDIYDLFEQTEKELVNEFIGIIEKYRQLAQAPLMPVLLEAFKYAAANSEIFIAYLRTKETTFLSNILQMCYPQNEAEWNILFYGTKQEHYEYYFTFIAFGCIALLRRWFDNGMAETPEYMASMAEKLMASCARTLA